VTTLSKQQQDAIAVLTKQQQQQTTAVSNALQKLAESMALMASSIQAQNDLAQASRQLPVQASEPQPLPVETVAPPVPAAPMHHGGASHNERDFIPEVLDKFILKKTREYRDNVFKLAKSLKFKETLDAQRYVFENTTSDYPKGYTAFRSQSSFAELDAPLNDSAMEEWVFEVKIPQGTSRREAMRLVHRESTAFLNRASCEAQDEHFNVLRPQTDSVVLEGLVTAILQEAAQPQHAEKFGLVRPLRMEIPKEVITARVEHLYAKIYEQLNHKLQVDEEARTKSRQAAQEADEKIASIQEPSDLLKGFVKNECKETLKEIGILQERLGESNQAVDFNDGDFNGGASEVIRAIQGNGQSPPGGSGHNQPRPEDAANHKNTDSTSRSWAHVESTGRGRHTRRKFKAPVRTKQKGKGKGKDVPANSPSGKGKGHQRKGKGKGDLGSSGNHAKGKGKSKGKNSSLSPLGKRAGTKGKSKGSGHP